MKVVKYIAYALFGAAVVIAVVGAMLPRTWKVERKTTIAAPPELIFPRVANLQRWQEWAAWNNKMDPQVVNTYSGPSEGVGAHWAWTGPKMGTGAMTITRAEASSGVWVDEQIEGDKVNAHGSITWAAQGDQTVVTWRDEGTLPPLIGGFFRGYIEEMLRGHFDKGLEGLKAEAEGEAASIAELKAAEAARAAEAAAAPGDPAEPAAAEEAPAVREAITGAAPVAQ